MSLTRTVEEISLQHYNNISINKKTNLTNNIRITVDHLLYKLLYKKIKCKYLVSIFDIILKYCESIILNRKFKRKAINPASKWYYTKYRKK